MHILIVEDDVRIARNITSFVTKAGFQVTHAQTGEDALFRIETETYDVIVLDWMLPDTDGISVLTKLREAKNFTPVLMLTAKSQTEDAVEGFTNGADDYVTKPFELREVLARIYALIRRKSGTLQTSVIRCADLTVDTNVHSVKRGTATIDLSPREYSLLEYLVMHANQTIDRLTLMHQVWGNDVDEMSNTVDVHIRYLRKKIDEPFGTKRIRTVKNKGYILCTD